MAIAFRSPEVRRRIPNYAVLRRLFEDASSRKGTDRDAAFNRLADVTGLSARMLSVLTPRDAQRTLQEVADAGLAGTEPTPNQREVMASIPPKLGEKTTMGAVKHAMRTPAVDAENLVRKDETLVDTPVSNLDALRTAYGDKATEAILSKMAERQAAGTGGEIMESNLTQPVVVVADPTIQAQGTSSEATGTIRLNPEILGRKLGWGPRYAAEARTAQQEEFVHNTAGTVGPKGQSQFWKTAAEKGFVEPSSKNPYQWVQKDVAKYSGRDYEKNAEEARAKLVTVARRIKAHPDSLPGGFDEWLKLAERKGAAAVGDSVLYNHVMAPMLQRDAKGRFTPEALRAQEWGKLVFQNWAANQPSESPSVRVSDNQYFVDGLT